MLDTKELVIGLGLKRSLLETVAEKHNIEFDSCEDLEKINSLPEQVCFNCDVVLVDQSMIHALGDHELQQILSKFPFAGSIVGTESSDPEVISELLNKGIQDFVNVNSNPFELATRVKSRALECRLRRNRASYYVGQIEVDVSRRLLLRDKKSSSLSPTEMNLLHCLAMANGNIIPRQTLKKVCWGQDVSDNALNRKLHEVRKSLKNLDKDVEIRTIYGTGFRLDVGNMRSTNSMPRI